MDCCLDYELACTMVRGPANITDILAMRMMNTVSTACNKLPILGNNGKPTDSKFLVVASCPTNSSPSLSSKCENSSEDISSKIPVMGEHHLFFVLSVPMFQVIPI